MHWPFKFAQVGGNINALEVNVKRSIERRQEADDIQKYVSETTMLEVWGWSKIRVDAAKRYCMKQGGKYWKFDKYEKNLQIFLVTQEESVSDRHSTLDIVEASMQLCSNEDTIKMLSGTSSVAMQDDEETEDKADKDKKDKKVKKDKRKRDTRTDGEQDDEGGQEKASHHKSKIAKARGTGFKDREDYRSDLLKALGVAVKTKFDLANIAFTADLLGEVSKTIEEMENKVKALDSLQETEPHDVLQLLYQECVTVAAHWAAVCKNASARIKEAKPVVPKKRKADK